jgi:hypothetical protein
METKKPYVAPQVLVHGSIQELTRQGNAPNRDLPNGNNNNAYPNAS